MAKQIDLSQVKTYSIEDRESLVGLDMFGTIPSSDSVSDLIWLAIGAGIRGPEHMPEEA